MEKKIIAGTGHRPKWLPCKYDEKHQWCVNLKLRLHNQLLDYNPDFVISGMALGWDTWLAEEAISLNIPIRAYIPFEGQGNNWPEKSKSRYKEILSHCEKIEICSGYYHKRCFFDRDERMVDDSNLVFALWNPEIKSGGTFYTVNYADKKEKSIVNFWKDI